MEKQIASADRNSFNCPHCGTYTSQKWFKCIGDEVGENKTPVIVEISEVDELMAVLDVKTNVEANFRRKQIVRTAKGQPFVTSRLINAVGRSTHHYVANLFLSECFTCKDVTIWLRNSILYPNNGEAPPPNEDLPHDIKIDYLEASKILNDSPRGAAALARLCIQKLCIVLGEKGKNINDDIGKLVSKGLPTRVQQALDYVRVVGNNAVHPGQIDLKDDRKVALSLLTLINLISEKMISEEKKINELYSSLPEGVLKGIKKRDNSK